jgi:hypothetical protein
MPEAPLSEMNPAGGMAIDAPACIAVCRDVLWVLYGQTVQSFALTLNEYDRMVSVAPLA